MLLQQGDVLLQKCTSIPKGAKVKKPTPRGYVLAEGEVTGHAHTIVETGKAQLFESDNEVYLKVIKEVTLKHEEHKAIVVPIGDYKVGKVIEYDHFAEEARAVKD
jgi:hypothetical protein